MYKIMTTILPDRFSKKGQSQIRELGPEPIYGRSVIETALWKKKKSLWTNTYWATTMPQACAGPGSTGEWVHKVPASVHRHTVNKGIRCLHIVLSPRKSVTGWCPRKQTGFGIWWVVRKGPSEEVTFAMIPESWGEATMRSNSVQVEETACAQDLR